MAKKVKCSRGRSVKALLTCDKVIARMKPQIGICEADEMPDSHGKLLLAFVAHPVPLTLSATVHRDSV